MTATKLTFIRQSRRFDVEIVPEGEAYSAQLHINGEFRGEIAYTETIPDAFVAIDRHMADWYPLGDRQAA